MSSPDPSSQQGAAPPDAEQVRALFLAQGFARVGITSAEPLRPDDARLARWLGQGRAASMTWLSRSPERRADPRALLPGARSVLCVAAAYPPGDHHGPIAAYARGEDYHRTLRAALERGVAGLGRLVPGVRTRVCVDLEPLLERALAARAGLGWIGKSTLLLDAASGPWLLLGEVLTDLPLPPDPPAVGHCGTCTACLDACPTGALDAPWQLDARRCLSYWTIEHRGPLPDDWATRLGHRVFGCDDCLTACPFPRRREGPRGRAGERRADGASGAPPATTEATPFVPRPDLVAPGLEDLERRAQQSFRRHFGSTPLERARKGGLLRNLAAVRGRGGGSPAAGDGPAPRG